MTGSAYPRMTLDWDSSARYIHQSNFKGSTVDISDSGQELLD